jgi:hypothetical protein
VPYCVKRRGSTRAHRIPLTPAQVAALRILVDELRQCGGGLSLSELNRRMGLAHSTVSGIVSRLGAPQTGRAQYPLGRPAVRVDRAHQASAGLAGTRAAESRLAPLASALERARPAERTAISEASWRFATCSTPISRLATTRGSQVVPCPANHARGKSCLAPSKSPRVTRSAGHSPTATAARPAAPRARRAGAACLRARAR